jgi:hypothetical protein
MSSAKTKIYPNSLILERGLSVFEKKRKDKLTNWSSGTSPPQRQQRWWLDSPDEVMARVYVTP